jgi:lipid II:glycine glycyltransferase (peptidoglycan interpeptide bridge formation enzyme)
VSAPFGTFRVPLRDRSMKDVIAGFQSRYRSYVRQAATLGAALSTGPSALDAFYGLYAATMERAGLWTAPRPSFERLLEAFGARADIGVVEAGGLPAASALVVRSRFGAFYLYGGTSREAPNYAGKFLHTEMMRRALDDGAAFYDFVGARLSDVSDHAVGGVQRFKAGFGADLVEGVLWKADISRSRCAALDIALRRRGAGEDIIDQERRRARLVVS